MYIVENGMVARTLDAWSIYLERKSGIADNCIAVVMYTFSCIKSLTWLLCLSMAKRTLLRL